MLFPFFRLVVPISPIRLAYIRMIDAMIKPMAKTKLAFEDKDIYRKPKNKDNKLKLNKGKDNLEKVSLMMDRG